MVIYLLIRPVETCRQIGSRTEDSPMASDYDALDSVVHIEHGKGLLHLLRHGLSKRIMAAGAMER